MDKYERKFGHETYLDMDNPSKLVGCCPYCGGDMYLSSKKRSSTGSEKLYYKCSKCHARSPIANNEDDAHLLAIKVMDNDHPYCIMWRYHKGTEWNEVGIAGGRSEMLQWIAQERLDHDNDEIQFKLRRLTDEEVNKLLEEDECDCKECHCHEN